VWPPRASRPRGAVKAEASIVYDDEEEEARTIASWTKVNRQQLDDVDGLRADLLLALRQGVLIQVEYLLVGTNPASGAPSVGIVNTPGLVEPEITATNLADAVGQAKAALATTGVVANLASAHPNTIEEEEARTGTDGHYVHTIDDQGRIRRLPLVPSLALAEGDVLVVDSRIGARLGVRQPVGAIIGQEQDDMTRNRVTALVEGRWAPIVDVPAAFAYFTLDAE
jgi:hypothetical protein